MARRARVPESRQAWHTTATARSEGGVRVRTHTFYLDDENGDTKKGKMAAADLI